MGELIIRDSEEKALLDDSDYLWFWQYTWFLDSWGYVRATHKNTTLHKEIWTYNFGRIPQELQIDHINRDKLDCRKINLRLVTSTEQNINKILQVNSTTGYKGVNFENQRQLYRARISIKRKRIHLGFYNTIEEAAKAYDKAAKIYHGKFAVLNFPEE